MNNIRWLVRGLALLSISLILLFIIGAIMNPTGVGPAPAEWVELFFFPFGITIGLILAWWREGLGGLITVGSLVAFYLLNLIVSGELPTGPYFFLLALPGFFFLFLNWQMPKQS